VLSETFGATDVGYPMEINPHSMHPPKGGVKLGNTTKLSLPPASNNTTFEGFIGCKYAGKRKNITT
jgi:hypothetical protein